MASYNSQLDLTLIIDQPAGSDGAPQWGDPMQFLSTGAGAANGDTIVSTDLGTVVTSDDDYVGYYVECVDDQGVESNHRVRRQIIRQSEALGVVTLFVERFPAQSQTGDAWRLINTIASSPWWAEDTGGSAIQVQDASRNAEANDFWNGTAEEAGPYLEVIDADNVAKTTLRLITDFTQAGGIADATLGANTAIGDLYEAYCCPEWMEHGFITCTYENIDREEYQGTMDTPPASKGRKVAQGQGTLLFRGPGTARGGDKTESHRIFSAALDVVDGGDLTVNGAGTTASIPYDAGTAVVGRMYCTNEGDVFMCTAAGTPAVPSPTLRSVCTDDTTVVGLQTFIPPTDKLLNHHLSSKQYHGDGIMERIWGLVPSISMSGELGQLLKIMVNLQGCDWERTYKDYAGAITRVWRAKRSPVTPVRIAGGRIVVNNTAMSFKSHTLNLGLTYDLDAAHNAPNQVSGYRLASHIPSGSLTGMIDSTNIELLEHELNARETGHFLIQIGSRTGFPGVCAFWAYSVQFSGVTFAKEGKNYSVSANFKVNDHDTDTTGLPTWAWAMG